jgi:hypothetical protein
VDFQGYTETERGYHRVCLLAADALTGRTRVLLEEQSETHVDPHLRWTRLIEEGVETLASSERGGWNHLYLYDGSNGKLKNRVTSGSWVVRAIESIDAKRRAIYFTAGGRELAGIRTCGASTGSTSMAVICAC